MTDHEWRASTAWRNAVAATTLNIVGMTIEIGVVRTLPHAELWAPLGSIAGGAILLAVLLANRHRRTVWLGNTAFLLNTAVILAALWIIDSRFATAAQPWVPFQEFKLGMVTVAILAPEAWVGGLSIAGYALLSLIRFETLPLEIRDHLALGEPWATIAIATFAAGLLWYRLRRTELELEIAVARAKLASTEHLARVLLAVRDLANTPLQTIALAAETVRELHPDLDPVMDRVARSLGKLRALDRKLRGFDEAVKWTRRDESLDALGSLTPWPGVETSGASVRQPRR